MNDDGSVGSVLACYFAAPILVLPGRGQVWRVGIGVEKYGDSLGY